MIGLRRGGGGAVVDPNLKLELKFNSQIYTDLAGTVAAGTNDYVRAWRSSVGGHLFAQATDAARPQRVSDGLYFDGGDIISLPSNAIFNFPANQDFCVEAYINTQSSANQMILSKNYWAGETGLALQLYLNTVLFSIGSTIFATSSAISQNAWHHIAGVRQGDNLKVFINGLSATTSGVSSLNSSTSYPIDIGGRSRNGTLYFIGKLTDLRIYDIAKYTANFTPPTRSA